MKGVVFLALSEMIQGMYRHKVWNEFLDESKVPSGGIYTSTEIYDDNEADLLLNLISEKLKKKKTDILFVFGLFLIKYFKRKYPQKFKHEYFVDFMSSVGDIVHVEIEKINPSCTPP